MLSFSKINYPTLKGLFGNEDGASRCFLVTMAAELFLLSGSIEGALKTLRGIKKKKKRQQSKSHICERFYSLSREQLVLELELVAVRTGRRGEPRSRVASAGREDVSQGNAGDPL